MLNISWTMNTLGSYLSWTACMRAKPPNVDHYLLKYSRKELMTDLHLHEKLGTVKLRLSGAWYIGYPDSPALFWNAGSNWHCPVNKVLIRRKYTIIRKNIRLILLLSGMFLNCPRQPSYGAERTPSSGSAAKHSRQQTFDRCLQTQTRCLCLFTVVLWYCITVLPLP